MLAFFRRCSPLNDQAQADPAKDSGITLAPYWTDVRLQRYRTTIDKLQGVEKNNRLKLLAKIKTDVAQGGDWSVWDNLLNFNVVPWKIDPAWTQRFDHSIIRESVKTMRYWNTKEIDMFEEIARANFRKMTIGRGKNDPEPRKEINRHIESMRRYLKGRNQFGVWRSAYLAWTYSVKGE